MAQTLIEKIVQRYAVGLEPGQVVHAGDYLAVRPKHLMTHDNTGAVIPKFNSIGAKKIHDPAQPVICIDHDIQNVTPENLGKYAKIEAFARQHGLPFYRPGSGIGHQIMVEEGFVTPGSMVVASDSHSNLYGGVSALGTPVVRTDAAAIWATGETWWEVPPIARLTLTGKLAPGVTGKDVIIALCGHFNRDEVLNFVVEFDGPGVATLTMDQRLSIANMTTEWGTLAGVFPFDEVLRDFLYARAEHFRTRGDRNPRYTHPDVEAWWTSRLAADPGAFYAKELTLDLAAVTPCLAGPNEVKTMVPLAEIEPQRIKVDKAYLLSCVNARLEDLRDAAAALRSRTIASHVKLYVAAASASIQEAAEREGVSHTLVAAGATVLPPGCGPCIGLGEGTLEKGEVGISATNRNFEGRMGSREALTYLASPAVVAASAAAGYICAPQSVPAGKLVATLKENPAPARPASKVRIREGFPQQVTGRLLFLPKDNLNTDGIYGKEFTYKDNLPKEEMAKAAMKNYDPKFQDIAREGDMIVGGENFGSGSSREQAATALAYRGIRMVIAGSFSQTYKRNAFNNGFIVFECPGLLADLRSAYATDAKSGTRTIAVAPDATVDFAASVIRWGARTYGFAPLGPVPQELIVAGGAEEVVRRRLMA